MISFDHKLVKWTKEDLLHVMKVLHYNAYALFKVKSGLKFTFLEFTEVVSRYYSGTLSYYPCFTPEGPTVE